MRLPKSPYLLDKTAHSVAVDQACQQLGNCFHQPIAKFEEVVSQHIDIRKLAGLSIGHHRTGGKVTRNYIHSSRLYNIIVSALFLNMFFEAHLRLKTSNKKFMRSLLNSTYSEATDEQLLDNFLAVKIVKLRSNMVLKNIVETISFQYGRKRKTYKKKKI